MKFKILKIIVIGLMSVFSQNVISDSSSYKKCLDRSNSDILIRQCGNDEYVRLDKILNQSWKNLLIAVDQYPDFQFTRFKSKESYKKGLLESQRLWLKFREAYCEHFTVTGGTMDIQNVTDCQINVLTHRINELNDLNRLFKNLN